MSDIQRRASGASPRNLMRAVALLCLALCGPAFAVVPGAAPQRARSETGRVLILSSFGSEFGFHNQVADTFRAELERLRGQPVDYYQVALESSRVDSEERQAPFVGYLAALFESRHPDLVVTFGGPAARFIQHYRQRLFPEVPVLFAASDTRHIDFAGLGDLDALSPVSFDLAATPTMILQLLPETRHLAVVLGTTPVERFWREELGRAFSRFEPGLELIWMDGQSLDEILTTVASLPPHSAVFFPMLLVDGAGTAHSQERVLTALHQASKAPLFGLYDSQMGKGIAGGWIMALGQVGRQTAEAATRLLAGVPPAQVRYPPILADRASFDARELARWRIPESRLPPGSEVHFRPDHPWGRYRWQILAVLALVGVQTSLIAFLFVHRARRRSAEREVRALHCRLLTTYEQERRRLARELHDDLTQRLARLAIDAAQVERQEVAPQNASALRNIREELVRLSDDVHTLSRRLHPSILDDLGLADALRSEAERFSRDEGIEIDLRLMETPPGLDGESALCLFRVAQEALRNVVHHARASRVELTLREADGNLALGVRDNGIGFDVSTGRTGRGIGLVSLRERLHLVGGRLEITSVPGKGTILLAQVPLGGASA